jgi:hypothetical protein
MWSADGRTLLCPKIDHAEQHVHLRVLCIGGVLSGVRAELFYQITLRQLPPGVSAITSRPPRDVPDGTEVAERSATPLTFTLSSLSYLIRVHFYHHGL